MDAISRAKPPLWLRIAQFPLTRLLLLGGVLFLMLAQSNTFMATVSASPLASLAVAAAMTALGLAVYVGFVRFVERRPVSELALPGMGRELGIGLAVGAGLYTGCVLILMVLGIYRIEGLNPLAFMLPAVAMALSSGIFEELLFRGALFRIVEEALRQLDLAGRVVLRLRLPASDQSGGHASRAPSSSASRPACCSAPPTC